LVGVFFWRPLQIKKILTWVGIPERKSGERKVLRKFKKSYLIGGKTHIKQLRKKSGGGMSRDKNAGEERCEVFLPGKI